MTTTTQTKSKFVPEATPTTFGCKLIPETTFKRAYNE